MDLIELIDAVPAVSPEQPFSRVLNVLSKQEAKVAAVIEDGKLLGIISQSEVARYAAIPQLDTSLLCARDLMGPADEKMPASTPVIDAARSMRSRRIQRLTLVDDDGNFVGMVTLRRVLFEVMDELDLKVDNLERELMADGPGG